MTPLAGCPGDPPIEPDESETSAPGTSTSTTAPTEVNATQIMTSDNTLGSTVAPTSEASSTTTTTSEPDTTDTGDPSTGEGPAIVVEGLARPESILHDTVDDVYLISSINGAPDGVDDDGFISRVLPDGTVDQLRFIDGADADVELDAPKGMAIVDEVLYVADITSVRKFDRVTGEPLGSVEIPGAVFLNDLVASPFARVYVSDTGANALHLIDVNNIDAVELILETPELAGPNGLVYAGEFLQVVNYNGSSLFQVALAGASANVVAEFEFGALDGLVSVADGLMVSSWDEQAPGVYHVSQDFTTVTPVVAGISSPADIEVDLGRNVLLIPNMLADRAEFWPL